MKIIKVLLMLLCSLSIFSQGESDFFIKGADVSMLKQLEDNGAKFYDENNKELDCVEILKNNGVNYIRIRTWVNPTDEKGVLLGGGNNDKETTIYLVEKAKKMGLKVLLDFHYSDFWADPAKQFKPKDWENLTGKELEDTLYNYTKDLLLELKNKGISPDMVQIGNELNGGMVWPNGKTWVQGNEKIGGYEIFSNLLKAGIKATKETTPDAKIMIHLADGGDNELYRRVFDEITKRGVEFDIISLSFYPYWHGTFNDLQKNLNDISKRYNKDVIVVEIAYAYTLNDGDGFSNIFGANEEITGGHNASVESQMTVIRKVMSTLANVPNNRGKGFFYWEPDWIPKKNVGWKAGEGNGWENQAMFDFKGKALPSLKVFNEEPKKTLEKSTVQKVNDIEIKTYINEDLKLPAEIDGFMANGAIEKVVIKWDKVDSKKLKKANDFTVNGQVVDSNIKVKAKINVSSAKNFIDDNSFESGDIWKNTKWILEDKKNSLQIEKNKANVLDGAISISYWKDSNFEFKIYQKITGLENGTYKLQVWSMGEKGGKTLNLFAKSKDNELKKNIVDTGWSKWNKFEITNIEVNNGELIIGVEGNCISGDWGKLDNFELIKTK
jgi:arabinogalactan endo-1,4-beta-galactosidase